MPDPPKGKEDSGVKLGREGRTGRRSRGPASTATNAVAGDSAKVPAAVALREEDIAANLEELRTILVGSCRL